MNICGEFRILTATTSTSNPTATAVDNASIFIAFDEVAAGAPVYKAAGRELSGTGAVSPAWPAHEVNDIALLFVESAGGQPVTLSDAQGFVQVAESPKATGSGTAGTQLSVFWARATSTSMAAPTVAEPGNHVYAQILTYCGVATSGNPWNITGGGTDTLSGGSINVTGVTTTVANTLIVQAATRDNDSAAAAFSAETNANLTNITEHSDAGTSSGNGGGFAVWDGIKAAAGATGDTNVTVTDTLNAFLTIALRPPPPFEPPSKLAFLQQPNNTIYNQTITPAVTVEIQDASGNRVATATNSVTVAIGTNPAGGTLSGTLTVNAVAGVATFSDLSINNAGIGYTLTASSAGLTGATSDAFNITTGAYGLTQCAGSRYGVDLGCTANDVQITSISVVGGLTSCEGGSAITVDLDLTINSGSPDRYDIGIFISNNGADPQLVSTGDNCTVGILPTTDPPFRNLDPGPWSGTLDTCGDVNGTMNGGTGSGTFTMYNVNVLCQSLTGSGGNLYIPFVVSWDSQSSPSGGTCTSIANPVPSTKSKCNAPTIAQGTVSVVVLPTITKTDNKTTLSPNEATTYTVVITNTTGDTLINAVFKDPAVTGLTANSISCSATGGAICPICSVSDIQGTGCTISSMPNNSSVTFTINATVSSNPPATFTNTATVTVNGATASASDTNGGSGSGTGGSRVRVIRWREVFQ
jgi:uncharacterized repeat protein (TIGR01451 family)